MRSVSQDLEYGDGDIFSVDMDAEFLSVGTAMGGFSGADGVEVNCRCLGIKMSCLDGGCTESFIPFGCHTPDTAVGGEPPKTYRSPPRLFSLHGMATFESEVVYSSNELPFLDVGYGVKLIEIWRQDS